MSNEVGRAVFVLVVLVFLGWFAIGTHLNIRKGHRVLRWLQDGMPLLGERTTVRWLGSSAIELKVQHARDPLRSAEVFVVLEPRDLPFLWWWFRSRGRRDLLIVRGELRAPPHRQFEALDRRAWSARGVERTAQRNRWTPLAMPPGSPLVAYGQGWTDAAPDILHAAGIPELSVVRVAVHRDTPNLEVHWELAGFARLESRRLFDTFHHIAGRV